LQVPRKKKDIKILHLENIYVIIVYKERGEIMGLFSRKPKESKYMEWHPKAPDNVISKKIYDEEKDYFTTFTGAWGWLDFSTFKNILFIIDEMARNHKELTDKIDRILVQNKELQERCETLENAVGIRKK